MIIKPCSQEPLNQHILFSRNVSLLLSRDFNHAHVSSFHGMSHLLSKHVLTHVLLSLVSLFVWYSLYYCYSSLFSSDLDDVTSTGGSESTGPATDLKGVVVAEVSSSSGLKDDFRKDSKYPFSIDASLNSNSPSLGIKALEHPKFLPVGPAYASSVAKNPFKEVILDSSLGYVDDVEDDYESEEQVRIFP